MQKEGREEGREGEKMERRGGREEGRKEGKMGRASQRRGEEEGNY